MRHSKITLINDSWSEWQAKCRTRRTSSKKTSQIVVHFAFAAVHWRPFFVSLPSSHRSYLCNHSFYTFDVLLVLNSDRLAYVFCASQNFAFIAFFVGNYCVRLEQLVHCLDRIFHRAFKLNFSSNFYFMCLPEYILQIDRISLLHVDAIIHLGDLNAFVVTY